MNTMTALPLAKLKGKIMPHKIVVLALFLLMIIVMTWLLTYATYATAGNDLEKIDTRSDQLTKENNDLTLDIAKSTSLPEIEKNAQNLGMNKNNNSIVLKSK